MPKIHKRIILLFLLFLGSAAAVGAAGEERFVYQEKNRRDPFEPLVTNDGRILPGARGSAATLKEVVVEGIIWDTQGKSVAIINGKLLKEQESIQGFQVLKINKESVLLQKEGRVMVVGLQKKGEEEDER